MIMVQYDNLYEKGDVVVFEKNDKLMVGIVTGYYVDTSAGDSIWYNIAVNKEFTYTYVNGGDVAEFNILCKLQDVDVINKVNNFIIGEQG